VEKRGSRAAVVVAAAAMTGRRREQRESCWMTGTTKEMNIAERGSSRRGAKRIAVGTLRLMTLTRRRKTMGRDGQI